MKTQQKLKLVLVLLLVTGLGLFSKFYTGFGQQWVNDYAGDLLYQIFWCLLIFILNPKTNINKVPLWVLGVNCFIEVLQLWKPPFLEIARSSIWGKLLLGTTFSWWDFLYYGLGCLIGWLLLRKIRRLENDKTGKS